MKIEEIRNMCIKALTKHGMTEADADVIVDEYLDGQ